MVFSSSTLWPDEKSTVHHVHIQSLSHDSTHTSPWPPTTPPAEMPGRPVVSNPELDERGSSMDQCYVLQLTSGSVSQNCAGWAVFPTMAARVGKNLSFVFVGCFSNPKRGITPSNHHKTVGSIWLSPHIFRKCCKLLQPSIPERSAMAFPAGSTRAKIWPRCRDEQRDGENVPSPFPRKKGEETRFTQTNQISCKWQLMCFITWFETPALSLLLLSS